MEDRLLLSLASILVIGIAAQWLAWRFRLPSILLFLIAGIVAGPVTGWLDPDLLLGDLLVPVVSLSVGVILFEGGLTLYLKELRTVGKVVRNLITIGVLVTLVTAALAAHFLAGLAWPGAILLGAILVVTGPTVIGPLLRHTGPIGPVGDILKWEGIIIDPIGATLAVLVFEALLIGEIGAGAMQAVVSIVKTILFGGGIGLLGAGALIFALRRHWIPESLDVSVTLTVVVAIFALSNEVQAESGLLATTVMGMGVANQHSFAVRQIVEFKENLRVLLLASLFVLLSARISLHALTHPQLGGFLFVLFLILVTRPLNILISTWGSQLSWKEKLFLMCMAPRGVVAAAVTSIFALEMAEAGYVEAERLVPLTFLLIFVTVIFYGLLSRPLSRWLGLAQSAAPGILFLGAHGWARQIAEAVRGAGIQVLLVDNNRQNTRKAQFAELAAYHGNVLSRYAQETIPLDGLNRLVALTPNEEVNSLAALHFTEHFGRGNVYQLPGAQEKNSREGPVADPLRGRTLFGEKMTYDYLDERFNEGAVVKATKITDKFTYADLVNLYQDTVDPLFLISQSGELITYSGINQPTPQAGQTLIFIAEPLKEERAEARHGHADTAPQTGSASTSPAAGVP